MMNGLPLGLAPSVLDPLDPRLIDSLDVAEESGTLVQGAKEMGEARAKKSRSADDAWFWMAYVDLPKASCNANLYLLQDDIPKRTKREGAGGARLGANVLVIGTKLWSRTAIITKASWR